MWGARAPAGDDMAPVLVGAPAELALMRIAAVFTEALGLEVSCSSCACSRYIPDHAMLACVNRMQGLAADVCIAASLSGLAADGEAVWSYTLNNYACFKALGLSDPVVQLNIEPALPHFQPVSYQGI